MLLYLLWRVWRFHWYHHWWSQTFDCTLAPLLNHCYLTLDPFQFVKHSFSISHHHPLHIDRHAKGSRTKPRQLPANLITSSPGGQTCHTSNPQPSIHSQSLEHHMTMLLSSLSIPWLCGHFQLHCNCQACWWHQFCSTWSLGMIRRLTWRRLDTWRIGPRRTISSWMSARQKELIVHFSTEQQRVNHHLIINAGASKQLWVSRWTYHTKINSLLSPPVSPIN